MSRFEASNPSKRRELISAAVAAHRERSSRFCTFEPDRADVTDGDDLGVPWVQCSGERISFDCTADELERSKGLLDAYQRYSVEEIVRPDDAAGNNVTVSTTEDRARIAEFVDDLFVEVFELPTEYRLWVAAV